MKNKLTQILGVLCLSTLTVQAQEAPNYVQGDILVRLNDRQGAQSLEREFMDISLSNATMLSEHMNIWKYTYDASKLDIDQAIATLYRSKRVHTAQRNHILTNRATPDDLEFTKQWQYFQVSDRDIDADIAWDLTTGGLSANGDTIVACVIDDGINLTHPDMMANLWVNYHEIPDNNIDDDGNGFIDDVFGWNANNKNDDVKHNTNFFEGHGSAVAGIVGAKGNNGIGVAGVNWNVKLMIVKGGGNESQAIAAYAYALENRKLYNQSNGTKGAFVVTTNASWGVNKGQAANAPLWCAMYDTLGQYGILSAGATANANFNIDVDGDLPTQCPSDFLVTVTNTNQSDVKVNSAGYGATTIDLGAPGEGTWTVAQFSSGYGAFGGTSGATPHVTGTIALMYSVPCTSFADLAKNDPAAAALLVKDYIMNGVDQLTSLGNGKTVTGGRLNIGNSVWGLAGTCGVTKTAELSAQGAQVKVYPNPTTNNGVNLEIAVKLQGLGLVELKDVTGKIIYQQDLNLNIGENQLELNFPELPAGIYYLELRTAEGHTALKLSKR